MPEFSAAFYSGWTDSDLRAEAERLGINVYGKNRRQMIDAIYNGELRRRQEEADSQPGTNATPGEASSVDSSDRLAYLEAENARLQAELAEARQRTGYVYGEHGPEERAATSDYETMTVKELRDLAEQRGVDLGEATRKADIIEALQVDERNQPGDAEAMKG
jgi:hypothetical protein